MSAPLQLRDYQTDAISEVRRQFLTTRRVLLVSGTGSGKTVIASEIIRRAIDKISASNKGGIIFLAHRKELIDQASKKLDSLQIQHGVLMASHSRRQPWQRVQVASVQTLSKRSRKPPASLIIIDECHRAPSNSYQKILAEYPGVAVLGLTATPCRLDQRGLGDLFQSMVQCPSVAELTHQGYLVPARIFAPDRPDLEGVTKAAGDYKQDELAKAVDKPKLTGSIVEHWLKLASERLSICFAVNREHGKHLATEFQAAGVKCEYVDGDTQKTERKAILSRLEAGATRMVVNVNLFTEGYDNPAVSCVVLARPTQSLSLALQMMGRGLRPHPGKKDVLILDHAGCVFAHGFPDDEREWSLDTTRKRKRKADMDPALSVSMCLQCYRAYSSKLLACPECGHAREKRESQIKTVEGQLQEITQRQIKVSANPAFAHFQRLAKAQGHKPGYAFVMYRQLFLADVIPVPPDVEKAWEAYIKDRGQGFLIGQRLQARQARLNPVQEAAHAQQW